MEDGEWSDFIPEMSHLGCLSWAIEREPRPWKALLEKDARLPKGDSGEEADAEIGCVLRRRLKQRGREGSVSLSKFVTVSIFYIDAFRKVSLKAVEAI